MKAALPHYSGADPEFIEGGVFKTIIPLTVHDTNQDTVQDTNQDNEDIKELLEFCRTPRTRQEMQQFMGLNNRGHFRKKILNPLIKGGLLKMTRPDKPTSRNITLTDKWRAHHNVVGFFGVMDESQKVNFDAEYAETVSVNFNPQKIDVDFIFISNLKRYDQLEIEESEKLVITSNVTGASNAALKVNYIDLWLCNAYRRPVPLKRWFSSRIDSQKKIDLTIEKLSCFISGEDTRNFIDMLERVASKYTDLKESVGERKRYFTIDLSFFL